MDPRERESDVESVVDYLQQMMSTGDLKLLLTEEEAWKQFVAGADLSREEEDALREALAGITGDTDGEGEDRLQTDLQDKAGREEEAASCEALGEIIVNSDVDSEDQLQNDLQDKKRFLDAFPQVKLELEERIRKLHALADKVDKVHRDCTISHVVANSTSAVSGVLTILGLALAPVTAGVSLGLSATGLGLGAAAAVTSVSTSIVDHSSRVSAEAEASQLVPRSKDTEKAIKEVFGESMARVLSLSRKPFQNLQNINKNIQAIKLIKANPRLATNAKRLMTTGKISARNTRQVRKAFGGTALGMTKGARILGAATAGVFLLMDVISLAEEATHLHNGAKSESAAELRQQAQDLEQKLQELIWIHDSLTQGANLPQCSSEDWGLGDVLERAMDTREPLTVCPDSNSDSAC